MPVPEHSSLQDLPDKTQDESRDLSARGIFRGLFAQAKGEGAKQAGTAFVIIATGSAVGVITQILVARIAGASNYGVYAFVLTWLQILGMLPQLGLENGLMRYLSAYVATRKFGLANGIAKQGYAVVLGSSVAVSLLWAIGVILLRGSMESDVANAMWVACLGLPFLAILVIGTGALRGLKKIFNALFPRLLLRRLLFGVTSALMYLFGRRDIGGAEIVAYDVGAIAICALLSFYWLKRAIPTEVKQSIPRYATRVWLKTSIPMGVSHALGFVVSHLDILLIGILLTASSTGIYAAATRIAGLAIFGLRAVNMVVAPLISEHFATGNLKAMQRVTTKACWLATAFTLLFAVVVLSFPEFVLGLFGNEFKMATSVLIILFLAQVVNSLTGPVGYILNMTRYEREAMLINAINAVAAVLALPIAINLYGLVGAAFVTATLTTILNLVRWIVVYRKLGIRSWVLP